MSRPRYEQPVDLINEKEVIEALSVSAFTKTVFNKSANPAVDYIGYGATGQGRVAIEIKRRKGNSSRYPEYFVAKQKVDNALKLKDNTGLRIFMIWAWDDLIAGIELDRDQKFREEIAGRTVQTRDKWDIEPMVYIPSAQCFFVNYDGLLVY